MVKIIIILLCLGLIGCTTVCGGNKAPQQNSKESGAAIDLKEIDNIIVIFSQAIEKNPNHAGAYYNRAAAYFYKKDYDKSWQDIHKAGALGIKVDPVFIALVDKLKKASGRER